MLAIVRSKTERLLRETLTERERVVQLLVEEVQFLRAQLGVPTITVQRAAQGEVPIPTVNFTDDTPIEVHRVPSAEADELAAMLQANVISQAEYADAIARLEQHEPGDIIE